jgi:acetylornithine deacetylase/succinyl-diaminopimelate desuccinylase-like protein
MVASLEEAFSRGVALQPAYGGSGPEGAFQQLFPKMEQAYSGFGPPENVIHAPNEYIVVDDYLKGIESVVRLLAYYAAAPERSEVSQELREPSLGTDGIRENKPSMLSD